MGNPDGDGGAGAGGTADLDGASESVHAVEEREQAGALCWVGPAHAVIPYVQVDRGVVDVDHELDPRRLRVLGDVGEGLGHDVVDADLGLLGKTVEPSTSG